MALVGHFSTQSPHLVQAAQSTTYAFEGIQGLPR